MDRTAERAQAPIGATPAEGPRNAANAGKSAARLLGSDLPPGRRCRPQPSPAPMPLRQPQLGPTDSRIQALHLGEVETLAEARLDVQGAEELHAGLRPWNDGARIGLLPWPASRLHQRTIPEICAMGDITVDDFTGSVV